MRTYLIVLLFLSFSLMAQEKVPFEFFPEPPAQVDSGNVIARMVEGLGYRYHWATKDLRAEDLAYRPSEEASSTLETLQHIYDLVQIILNAATATPSQRPAINQPTSYEDLRLKTLNDLYKARQLYRGKSSTEVGAMKVIFDRGGEFYSFPVWNLLNGPLSDALYHTGQIVSFRRTSGNPISKGVNVFIGKTKG